MGGNGKLLAGEVISLVIREKTEGGGDPEGPSIVLIVVGVVVGVVVLAGIGIGVFLWMRKRKVPDEREPASR
jgi:hypothetical protein